MKKRDIEKKLANYGWWFLRHGGNHDAWTNGTLQEYLPRHVEVNENLARKIIRTAEKNPVPKERK